MDSGTNFGVSHRLQQPEGNTMNHPQIEQRANVAAAKTVTRSLWGAAGTITRTRAPLHEATYWRTKADTAYWLEFDESQRGAGVPLAGVWLKDTQLISAEPFDEPMADHLAELPAAPYDGAEGHPGYSDE